MRDWVADHSTVAKVAIGIVVTIACVLGIALVTWRDPQAAIGRYEGPGSSGSDEAPEEVSWESMEISCASEMRMTYGDTRVEARLENSEANHCDQKIRMYPSDAPDDVLYESGAISPGEYLRYADLAHTLPIGRNKVTVEFQGYEQSPVLVSEEGRLMGHNKFGASTSAEVTIVVTAKDGGDSEQAAQ